MSILVVEVTSEGIIFGGDRNMTTTLPDGTTQQAIQTEKVLEWPNGKALIGFVGNGIIDGKLTTVWLQEFITRNVNFLTLEDLANKLRIEVEAQRKIDEGQTPKPVGMILHLGGFANRNGFNVPEIYLISNIHELGKYGYGDADQVYGVSEEFWSRFPNDKPEDIRKTLRVLAKNLNPFWFHQGFDLATFNILEQSVKEAFKSLCSQHPDHDIPKSILEWEKHVKMQILMYGAYFLSFHEQGRHYVGGGVDTVSIPWP